MFSGIIEQTQPLVDEINKENSVQITIVRPIDFDDLKIGDSIACNGVCLTLEAFNEKTMNFTLGPETLRVLHWSPQRNIGKMINLERSLRLGDRVHGHFVTGHVDELGQVIDLKKMGDTLDLKIKIPDFLSPLIWKKGSITVQGVSLTINSFSELVFTVGLIPETLKRTNLGLLKVGDLVNLEVDPMARAFHHMMKEFYHVQQN
ncbi:MAG TPA: riboflavin synthase [Pseudobdellovibrionaceae bacterium]|nr:riboflavin synthase [Pseudobdellovibrionaceae bacterium]